MLTQDDKKYLNKLFDKKFEAVDKKIGAVDKRVSTLSKDVVDLFNATNSVIEKLDTKLSGKIDDTNERIERILDNQNRDFELIENLEKKTGKLEEKVFATTISS